MVGREADQMHPERHRAQKACHDLTADDASRVDEGLERDRDKREREGQDEAHHHLSH